MQYAVYSYNLNLHVGNLMVDAGRFLIILAIFMFGFSMHVTALNQPLYKRNEASMVGKTKTQGLPSGGTQL